MRNITLILVLCFAAMAATALADDYPAMTLKNISIEQLAFTPSLDEQPDTIRYDDGIQSYQPQFDYWCSVRFTAPAEFTFREIYIFTINLLQSTENADFYVYGPDGPVQGQALATSTIPGPLPHGLWAQANLSTDVVVPAGEDFYVIFGPVPGGDDDSTGWKPLLDNGSTNNRSTICFTNNQFGNYQNRTGDLLVRAGGEVATFVDAEAYECFNADVDDNGLFNMLAGEELSLGTIVINNGSTDLIGYDVTWSVIAPDESEIFSETVQGPDIAEGGWAPVFTTGTFTASQVGAYKVTSNVVAEGDALTENDETYLRFYVGGLERWYMYDDDGDADAYSGFGTGSGWGLSFTPTEYPAKVTQIRLDVSGTSAADFRIYLNGEEGTPQGAPVWTWTNNVVNGWNEIDVDPPIDLFEGQSFTVAYLWQSGVSMGYDATPPNLAGIQNMPTIAWQASDDGGTWTEDDGGNLCIQAFIDASTAIPPYPIIEVTTSTLNFGQVATNDQMPLSFWVYNRGNVDDLEITDFTFLPASYSSVYIFDQASYTVPAQDSVEVTLTFAPAVENGYNGRVTLVNNSENEPAYNINLVGSGIIDAITDPATGLPTEFELSQNYPNPFNPSTDIQFALPYDTDVNLTVSNLLGQEVATIATGLFNAGFHTVNFNAAGLPSGLYFYKLQAADFTDIRKMMLLK